MDPADLRAEFPAAPGYLDTASLGLPPPATVAALREGIDAWQRGEARAPDYDHQVARSRELVATLLGVPPGWVAVAGQVSSLIGVVASSLPEGAVVLAPEEDFTSVLFPFLAAARRGVETRTVPLEGLAESVGPEVDVVAWSLVQSADGRVVVDEVLEAAAPHGTLTVADATQALGWLPVNGRRFDVVVAGGYKWLLNPRGTAFASVRPERWEQLTSPHPGWYAGEDVWTSIYGPPLRLAGDARRYDLSPAWLCWVGAVPSLELIASLGVEAIHRHDVGLADRLRVELGGEPGGSAIVALDLPEGVDPERLEGITASVRAGRIRVGFHLYNTEDDLDRLLGALRTG